MNPLHKRVAHTNRGKAGMLVAYDGVEMGPGWSEAELAESMQALVELTATIAHKMQVDGKESGMQAVRELRAFCQRAGLCDFKSAGNGLVFKPSLANPRY